GGVGQGAGRVPRARVLRSQPQRAVRGRACPDRGRPGRRARAAVRQVWASASRPAHGDGGVPAGAEVRPRPRARGKSGGAAPGACVAHGALRSWVHRFGTELPCGSAGSRAAGRGLTGRRRTSGGDLGGDGLRTAPSLGAGRTACSSTRSDPAAAMEPRADRGPPARWAQGAAGAGNRALTLFPPAARPAPPPPPPTG